MFFDHKSSKTDAVTQITGAGATFPYPLYAKWAEAYKGKTGVSLNYQSIGSGGGIKQIEAGTVNFGASDKPLSAENLEKNKLVQFPAVIGDVVLIVNIEGITPVPLKNLKKSCLTHLTLGSRGTLSVIFMRVRSRNGIIPK